MFHEVFHQMTAGMFNHTNGDLIVGFQVYLVFHSIRVVGEVTTLDRNFRANLPVSLWTIAMSGQAR
jgi:hypothetical protein